MFCDKWPGLVFWDISASDQVDPHEIIYFPELGKKLSICFLPEIMQNLTLFFLDILPQDIAFAQSDILIILH